MNNTQVPQENEINQSLKRSSRAYFIYYIATQAAFDRGIFILFLLSQGFDSAQVGLLQSILFGAAFLCEIPTGLMGDKYGRKKSVFMGLLAYIGYSFGVISFTGFSVFVGFYALYGFAMSLVSGSDRSLIYDTFKQHNKEASFIKLESLSRSVGSIVLGLAIILGGVLQAISWDAVYIAYAGVLVIAMMAISFIPEPKLQVAHHDEDFDLVKNASRHFTVGDGRKQLPLILFMSMISFAFYPYFIFTQSALTDLGMSVENVAWVFAAAQLASAAGYFTAGKLPQKNNLKVAFIICPVLLSLLYLISQMGGMTMIVTVFFVICYIDKIIEPIYVTHLNEGFDSKIRAFSNSFDSFVQTIFISLGFYLYGVLSIHWGFSLTAQVSSVLPIVALFLAWRYLSKRS